MITTDVDVFLADGCGRCEQFATPACKVRRWPEVLAELRALLLDSGLTEEMKWGSPCYTDDGRNVVMLGALKDGCALGFFKGALLADPDGLLESPGPNSQAARQLRFRSVDEVRAKGEATRAFLAQAIAVERSGAKVAFREAPEPEPEELTAVLDADPAARAAFDALTPGRRRSHILHVLGAKQAATRRVRAERCLPKILAGKGFLDR